MYPLWVGPEACARKLEQEPSDDDLRGFEWGDFGVNLLELSPVPESWWQ